MMPTKFSQTLGKGGGGADGRFRSALLHLESIEVGEMPIPGVCSIAQFKLNSKSSGLRVFANLKTMQTALIAAHAAETAADQTIGLMTVKDRCEDWLVAFRKNHSGDKHRGQLAANSKRYRGVKGLFPP